MVRVKCITAALCRSTSLLFISSYVYLRVLFLCKCEGFFSDHFVLMLGQISTFI